MIAKIAVVDDHQLFLDGISLIVDNMNARFTVTSYPDPLKMLKAIENGEDFDLIICDLIMTSMNGLAFVGVLRSQSKIPVLMLSGISTAPPIDEMRRLGAQGFIHKSADNETLTAAVTEVLAGQEYFADIAGPDGQVAVEQFGDSARIDENRESAMPQLTERQLEVLKLISQGASNKDIATQLEISENTVKSHLKLIFEELQVNKRTACVRAATTLGLI